MIEICSEEFPLGTVIALEELSVPYKIVKRVTNEKSLPPINYKQCYIVDTAPSGSTDHIYVHGSCAILEYLSDKYRMLIPDNYLDLLDTKQWLYWYCSYLEPFMPGIMGLSPLSIDKSSLLDRFSKINRQLERKKFLARLYSIADIVFYTAYKRFRQAYSDHSHYYSNLEEWMSTIEKRPAAVRAIEKAAASSH
ncbi:MULTISPECIES: glutathione S-transferase family protein [Candidatus Ichthyocystis]|uniref:Putative glutathione-S-transferase n=1 Tax=Candidatus Ichthyocystis hellenicum TaxID=1561003 RepID=A0A0S4M2W5_9BURK|nr:MULTISPECIES: glutathione S-transferase family protein [Ichthyocystis]CUT18030.1 putative glutathione-S-transferase [Candidatus Ichthyocystis hellenicum]